MDSPKPNNKHFLNKSKLPYITFSHQIFMNIVNITNVNSAIINRIKISNKCEKSYTFPFIPVFFMLLTVKSFKILPKHN